MRAQTPGGPASDPLQVNLFGALRVITPSAVLGARGFPGVKPRQLLEVLLCERGHALSKSRLAEHLWGDALPTDHAATLETYVSVLRRTLAPGQPAARSVVVTEHGGYRIGPGGVLVDLDVFDSRRQEALAASEPAAALAALRQALELVRGPVLEDEPHAAWAEPLRQTYAERHVTTLVDAGRLLLALGDPPAALELAQQATVLQPLAESAYQLLMAAAYVLRRQDEALAAFDRCRRLLAEELGVDPVQETVALQLAILRHEPLPPSTLVPAPVRPAARAAGPPGGERPVALSGIGGDGLLTRLEDVVTMAFHGVPGCDAAAVTVLVGGGVVTVGATNGAASDLEAVQRQLGSGPALSALRHGRVVVVDDHRLDARWPRVGRAAVAHGLRSTLALPLLHEAAALGALTMHSRQPAAFGRWAGHVGRVLARQAAGAIAQEERGRRTSAQLAVERRITRALQHDLVPLLPSVPGIVTAGRYLAAEDTAEVGGDWYDVFPLPHQAIGLVIGDVMGHGIAAAHGMSQLRTALRVCAYGSPGPADVLDRLDRLVQFFDLALTTAVYGTLALGEGGAELVFCNAGHPPPLVRWPDGRVSQLDGGSSWLLGGPTAQLGRRQDAAVQLPSGAVLVLYTDGLVERRRHPLDHGIGRLRDALAGVARVEAPDVLCDRLLDALCEAGRSDDLALLAVLVR